jgi:hypothetical protein
VSAVLVTSPAGEVILHCPSFPGMQVRDIEEIVLRRRSADGAVVAQILGEMGCLPSEAQLLDVWHGEPLTGLVCETFPTKEAFTLTLTSTAEIQALTEGLKFRAQPSPALYLEIEGKEVTGEADHVKNPRRGSRLRADVWPPTMSLVALGIQLGYDVWSRGSVNLEFVTG